jgi:hypothetical protein
MKRYNIAVKKVFQSQGKERNQWNQVGTLTQFPCGQRQGRELYSGAAYLSRNESSTCSSKRRKRK